MKNIPNLTGSTTLFKIRKGFIKLDNVTKVELSKKIGISFPTVSKFLDQMESNGEIVLIGLDKSSGGRKAKRYRYNSDYMLGLAIFLEERETQYTVFNCMGEIKKKGQVESVLNKDSLGQLTNYIQEILIENPTISSIAIGLPASVDNGNIFHIPKYDHLQNFNLKDYYEEYFSIPVTVENDMNAAVLGYKNNNNNNINEINSLVYLYLGQNGPGVGLLVNGLVLRGTTNFAGEVSFVPLYNKYNFQQAFEKGHRERTQYDLQEGEIDAISRLVVTFTATINPHTIIFSDQEFNQIILDQISDQSSNYVSQKHLPKLIMSNWKQDYLYGLQSLGIDLMMNETSRN
ncbi:ROK family protein [Priestia aryabhattai]|uniref:ROK family transcriptional regulator n=1 Tax=Priestia aryabhattai TaxID=412384 RepID=UPI003D2CC838